MDAAKFGFALVIGLGAGIGIGFALGTASSDGPSSSPPPSGRNFTGDAPTPTPTPHGVDSDPIAAEIPSTPEEMKVLIGRLQEELQVARNAAEMAQKETAMQRSQAANDAQRLVAERTAALQAALVAAESQLAAIQEKLGGEATEKQLTPEEIAERIEQAKTMLDGAFADKNGDAAIKAIRILIELGQDGYPDAMDAILRVHGDVRGAKTLGLMETTFYRYASDHALYEYALDRSNNAPDAFRVYATWGYPWMVEAPALVKTYAANLPNETNDAVAQAMIYQLGQSPTTEAAAALIVAYEAAGQARNVPRQRQILQFLGQNPNDNARNFIRHVALYESNDSLRRLAESMLSTVAGIYINRVVEGSQAQHAGLRAGDILTKYNGHTITSMPQLGQLRAQVSEAEIVTLEVYRDGAMLPFSINGGVIGIDGHFVAGR